MAYARWASVTDWRNWDGSYRLVGSTVKLPYRRIAHIGTGEPGTPGYRYTTQDGVTYQPSVAGEIKALWRIGEYYSSGSEDISNTNLMSITSESPSSDEMGQRLFNVQFPNVPTESETTEIGIYCPARNGYAFIEGDDSENIAQYPASGKKFYVGCWFKSTLTDYASGVGYIISHRDTAAESNNIGFAIYVDTDNCIKAAFKGASSTQVLSSSVQIDTEWHYALLIVGVPGSLQNHYLIIDNKVVVAQSATAGQMGTPLNLCVKSISTDHGANGFAGAVDEIVIAEWSGPLDLSFENYRFESSAIVSPIVDTGIQSVFISQLLCNFETPSNTSVSFAFKSANTEGDLSSKNWSGYTSPSQILSRTDTDLISLGIKGRYNQIGMKLTPSFEPTNVRKYDTPSVTFLQTVYDTESISINMGNSAYLPGQVLGQTVNFSGTSYFDKISMNYSLIKKSPVYYITGSADAVSFQAANFASSRDAVQFQAYQSEFSLEGMTLDYVGKLPANRPEVWAGVNWYEGPHWSTPEDEMSYYSEIELHEPGSYDAIAIVDGDIFDIGGISSEVLMYFRMKITDFPRMPRFVIRTRLLGSSPTEYAVIRFYNETTNTWDDVGNCDYTTNNTTTYFEIETNYIDDSGFFNAILWAAEGAGMPGGVAGKIDYVALVLDAETITSSGLTLYNKAQIENYSTPDSAASDSPYLQYNILFTAGGVYDLWCLGMGNIYWCFDDDITNMRSVTLGSTYPLWTKFGVFKAVAGEIHTFTVYLADTASSEASVILDQWFFTTDINLSARLDEAGDVAYTTCLPLSACPFNTSVTISSSGSENVITLWKPSAEIADSGKVNYAIPSSNRQFQNGLTIEYRQIGGNADYCALWNYTRTEESVGPAYRQDGFGEDIVWET